MNAEVRRWLEEGIVDLFLGYKMVMGHPLPYCFVKEKIEEVDSLIIGPSRYALEKIATHITVAKPDIKIGMLARDCNQRDEAADPHQPPSAVLLAGLARQDDGGPRCGRGCRPPRGWRGVDPQRKPGKRRRVDG